MYWSICIIYHIWRRQQYSGGICWSYSCVSAHQTKYPIFCSTHVSQTMILHIDHRQLAHLYQNCNLCDPCISRDQCQFYSSMLAHQTKYPIFCGKWVGWPIWQIEYSKSAELSNIVYTIFVEQARYVCVLQQRLGQPNCISAIQCQACWPGLCTGDNMSAHLYHIYDIPCFCHQLWDMLVPISMLAHESNTYYILWRTCWPIITWYIVFRGRGVGQDILMQELRNSAIDLSCRLWSMHWPHYMLNLEQHVSPPIDF